MAISEAINIVQGPKSSKQSSSIALPKYMLRRVNIPGPNTGFPVIASWGPKNVTASSVGQFTYQIPGAMRILALGWYTSGAGGATVLRFGRTTGVTSLLSTSMSSSNIDLAATPTGVIFLNDTGSSIYIAKSSWVSGADSALRNDPEMPPQGTSSPLAYLNVTFSAATTIDNFCVYALLMPTKHANTLATSD